MWHCVHCESETCGRFTWFLPVAKLTSSWQLPHAARLGLLSQLSACAAPVTCVASWQKVQRRGSLGNSTVLQSETDWLKPIT